MCHSLPELLATNSSILHIVSSLKWEDWVLQSTFCKRSYAIAAPTVDKEQTHLAATSQPCRLIRVPKKTEKIAERWQSTTAIC